MAKTETNHSRLNGKRLCYRAWHRGTRELDLLLGPFIDAELEILSESECSAFAELLELPDTELHDLITCGGTLSEPQQNLLLQKLRLFHGLAA